MGLDMYAYVVPEDRVVDDFTFNRDEPVQELQYWRKHPDLHGLMEEIWRERLNNVDSISKEVFNCQPIRLYPSDLDRIEKAVREKALPNTIGFFFGESFDDEETRQEDLDFVNKARTAITDGMAVYYNSWW